MPVEVVGVHLRQQLRDPKILKPRYAPAMHVRLAVVNDFVAGHGRFHSSSLHCRAVSWSAGRAQLIFPASRIRAAQHIFPAFWRWSSELILILCSVGAAQHIVPVFRVRSAELILMFCSVRAAQQVSCVLVWL
jgi:hypothetical protein